MSIVPEVKNLEDLIRPTLSPGKELVSYKTKSLLSSGENYGSILLAVEVAVKDCNDNKEEVFQCVAKLCPPKGWLWGLFNVPATYKTEVGTYQIIIPTLQKFQKDQGMKKVMDFFPKYFGSRTCLDPHSDVVDENAVLLLENLKLSGYSIYDRFVGYDLECARFLLKDLAVFHAVPIAYKLAHTELFWKKFGPYLNKDFSFKLNEEVSRSAVDAILGAAKTNKDCHPLLARIQEGFERGSDYYKNTQVPTEPWGTIIHNDYWGNNAMTKFEKNKPIRNVMIDFQLVEYSSPARDVLFFLYSSVQLPILKANYDSLIALYYDTFIDTLKQLKCDVEKFTYESFLKEIDLIARECEFFHLLIMMKPMYTLTEKAKDLHEVSESDFVINVKNLHPVFNVKLCEISLEFAQKGWI